MSTFLYLILASFLVETLTQLIQNSVFFSPLRALFSRHKYNVLCRFIHTILECPYCTSVWVSMFITICILLSGYHLVIFGNLVLDYFVFFIASHRISNAIHDGWDRYLSRHYKEGFKNE